MILFFGDSLTSADNNGKVGFVEKLNLSASKNYGVSGTTIGNYSLYPVEHYDLESQLYINKDVISTADKIVLEYGCNDISSVLCEVTNINTVIIGLVKAIDYIRQINKNIKIYFISVGVNVDLIAGGQCAYLNSDYLKNTGIRVTPDDWVFYYTKLVNNIRFCVDECIELESDLTDYMDIDGLHPNNEGYNIVANELKGKLK